MSSIGTTTEGQDSDRYLRQTISSSAIRSGSSQETMSRSGSSRETRKEGSDSKESINVIPRTGSREINMVNRIYSGIEDNAKESKPNIRHHLKRFNRAYENEMGEKNHVIGKIT